MDPYRRLAEHLDALPNGFPLTKDRKEQRVLAKIFSPAEADLAAQLTTSLETVEEIARRTGLAPDGLSDRLKAMARRGLIEVDRKDRALAFKTLPFIVGIYEMQVHTMDAELAQLVEDYFQEGFGGMLALEPQFHRVVAGHDTVHESVEVQPFEGAAEIVDSMQSWAVLDCICRKQKALIGQACKHPIDVCMAINPHPDAFAEAPGMRALSRDEAMATLRRAAEAGLVHTVSNSVEGVTYICNCCTCSCGILRGMAELGLANVVARSPFVNQVQEALCAGCEDCIDACQFSALSMQDGIARLDRDRCVGCGVCVLTCSPEALGLVRRPAEEIKPIPQTHADWAQQRLVARGL